MIRAKEAWERVAECAALAEEARDTKSRLLFTKLRDSWVQIAHDCERVERGTPASVSDANRSSAH